MIKISEPHEIVYWNFNREWKTYEACLNQCRERPKTKPVHEIRTTLRRLVATLDVLQEIQPSKAHCILRKELKKGLNSTRDLRDFQSQEKILKGTNLAALDEFKCELRKRRKNEQKRVQKHFLKVNLKKQRSLTFCLNDDFFNHSNTQATEVCTRLKLEQTLKNKFDLLEKSANQAQFNDPTSVHEARIQFKKFRYAWDALAPLIPRSGERENTLRNFQKLLGEIQDLSVQLQLFLKFLIDRKETRPAFEFVRFFSSVEIRLESGISRFFSERKRFLKQVNPWQKEEGLLQKEEGLWQVA